MPILTTTLEVICKELNSYLQNAMPRQDNHVVLSSVQGEDGHPFEGARNKLVMCLAGLRRETTISNYTPGRVEPGQLQIASPLYLDLQLLFYANFTAANYAEGLSVLSLTISFFQQKVMFDRRNTPALDPRIDRLAFEFVNLSREEQGQFLQGMGLKYLPLALYDVRMIPFSEALMAKDLQQWPATQ